MKHLLRVALLAILVSFASVASARADLLPTLTCATYDSNTNTLFAVFGYVSSFGTTTHLDVGVNNFFSPGVLFRNQPTDFLPGAHADVFATSFQISASQPQITWELNGSHFVVAKQTSGPDCSQIGTSNALLNGIGPPANSLGIDGDFYVDTSADVLYGPKAAGVWPTPGILLIGPPGNNGTNGTNGNTTLNGAGAPADALGTDGDFYIDTAADVLYGPKAGGHWPATGISLVGSTGHPGPQGPPGPAPSLSPLAPAGAPVVSIASPSSAIPYTRGQALRADYSCFEGTDGPGISSCGGTVANGHRVDTTSIGTHTFKVVAVSSDGQRTSRTVTYRVVIPTNVFSASAVRSSLNGMVRFSITIPGPGRLDVLETAWNDNLARAAIALQPASRRFVYARTHVIARGAQTINVSLRPNARGRRLVAHHRYPVTLRLWVSYTPTHGVARTLAFRGLHLAR